VKRYIIIGIFFAALILVASCATAPKKPGAAEEPAEEPAVTPAEKPVEIAKVEEVPLPEAEYIQAKELRERILRYDLNQYAQNEYDSAEKSFIDGESAYGKDNARSKASFDQAIKGYTAVLQKGFTAYLDGRVKDVEKIKKSAEAIKAPVAVKDDYAKAKSVYEQALGARKAGENEEAAELLDEAEGLFTDVYDVTLEKKTRAEKSIEESRTEIQTLEEAVEQEELE